MHDNARKRTAGADKQRAEVESEHGARNHLNHRVDRRGAARNIEDVRGAEYQCGHKRNRPDAFLTLQKAHGNRNNGDTEENFLTESGGQRHQRILQGGRKIKVELNELNDRKNHAVNDKRKAY